MTNAGLAKAERYPNRNSTLGGITVVMRKAPPWVVLSFFLSLASFVSYGTALAEQDAPIAIVGATTVDASTVVQLILNTPGLVVVDTRTKADFEMGHIDGAINIVDTDMISEQVLASVISSKTMPVLFYCNGVKCGRAAHATKQAVEWGYTHIFYYALGIRDWKEQQFPLTVSVFN